MASGLYEYSVAPNLNGKNIVDKKYSVSYLDSTGIDCNSLSHFIIKSGNNKKIEISPFENSCSNELEDLSVKRAKEVLENIKNKGCLYDVNLIIDNINAKLQHYAAIQMPFMKEYLWHIIENKAEDFGLSAVRHIISSDGFCKDNSTWYFGFLPEKRLCALAVKKESETDNPFTNVCDCTVVYSDTKINEHFFVAGILLLDDGQYFCRLSWNIYCK